MIADYKGDKPKNVVDPAQRKDKPYYKKVGFWVALALMLFGLGCSVFGCVMGYRYSKAIENASRTIAEARSADDTSLVASSKPRSGLVANNTGGTASLHVIDFSYTLNRSDLSAGIFYKLSDGEALSGDYVEGDAYFTLMRGTYIKFWYCTQAGDNPTLVGASRENYIIENDFTGLTFQATTGMYSASSTFTMDGVFCAEGYQAYYQAVGYDDGYSTGFNDGITTDDVAQSIHVSSNLSSGQLVDVNLYVNDEFVYTYHMSDGSVGTYSSFTLQRSRGDVVRLAFQVVNGDPFNLAFSAEPIVIADGFTSLTPQFEYEGAYYMPTNLFDYYLCIVGFTDAPMASTLYDVYFDADEMLHSVTSSYNVGYVNGYDAGNSAGYTSGLQAGDDAGYERGFQDGRLVGFTDDNILAGMFVTAFQQPFNQLYRFLNFNLLGINFLSLFTALITVSVGLMVIKKVL